MEKQELDRSKSPFTLYYNQFSICSLMVLLTLRWKGQPKSSDVVIEPVEEEIDIYVGDQMEESYLEKNWKGQVPALIGPSIVENDSLDITRYLAKSYPRLLPSSHLEVINSLLKELHQIWFVSLSFQPEERRGEGILNMTRERSARPSSSEKYKAALQRKLDFLASTYTADPHAPEIVARERSNATRYFDKVAKIKSKHGDGPGSPWIFGDSVGPTALDAHTTVFIARLLDAGSSDLINEDMLTCGKRHLESREWEKITQGKTTLHSLWENQQQRRDTR